MFSEESQIQAGGENRFYKGKGRTGVNNGTRKQKEIHVETKAKSIQDRKGLQETWREH
jgi:hypothetical protein